MSAYPVKWWENNRTGSAVLDVTNPAAVDWFKSRLREVQKELGIDGFKLDAGETVYIPPLKDKTALYFNKSAFGSLETQPLEYTRLYASIADDLGGFTEVRAAWRTQPNRNFVRIMDLDSSWGSLDGIGSVIPRVLLFGTLGYRYVLPDMIGGNGYGVRGDLQFRGMPTAELYIRWIQCNLLLPMQFSISPWRYKNDPLYPKIQEVLANVFTLREELLPYFREAVREAVESGLPIARPIWHADPRNPASWPIEDQYMVGRSVVVAPVLQPNSTSRTIVIPKGSWMPCTNLKDSPGRKKIVNMTTSHGVVSWKSLAHDSGKEWMVVQGPLSFGLEDVALTSPTPCFVEYSHY